MIRPRRAEADEIKKGEAVQGVGGAGEGIRWVLPCGARRTGLRGRRCDDGGTKLQRSKCARRGRSDLLARLDLSLRRYSVCRS